MAVRITAELPLPEGEGVSGEQFREFANMLGVDGLYADDGDINVQVVTDDSGEPALRAVWLV